MKHDFPNKIIFLDVDGVINIPDYTRFDKKCQDNLLEIVKVTGAKIVVSSSWRETDAEAMKKNFKNHGVYEEVWNNVIDVTIRGYQCIIKGSQLPIVRGNEIKAWVDTHLRYPWHSNSAVAGFYEIKDSNGVFKIMDSNKEGIDYSYVILDDDSDMLYEQRNNFIHTDGLCGLTMSDANNAIKILNQ